MGHSEGKYHGEEPIAAALPFEVIVAIILDRADDPRPRRRHRRQRPGGRRALSSYAQGHGPPTVP